MTFLIDFGAKSALALGIAFLLAFLWRRRSASVRYAVWTCALTAVLLLPLAVFLGPRWNILPVRSGWHLGAANPVIETAPSLAMVVQASRRPRPDWLMILWTAGLIAMLVRIGAGHWRVRSLFGKAERIRDPHWLSLAHQTASRVGFRRAVILKRCTATDVPLSYGLFHATILLPDESDLWSGERRRIVLAHEMIHARRLDSLWGLLSQCALAMNWFNPLAWLAATQFRRERERSCDDAVVLAGTASTLYASHLVDLARSVAILEAAPGMAERSDLERRIHALLDSTRQRDAISRTSCATIMLAALALIVPLAAVRAQSISKPLFSDVSSDASNDASVPTAPAEKAAVEMRQSRS
jgi:beta-lactamase regulating signal transducer with metallopeptidase domain